MVPRTNVSAAKPQGQRDWSVQWLGPDKGTRSVQIPPLKLCDLRLLFPMLTLLCSSIFGNWGLHSGEDHIGTIQNGVGEGCMSRKTQKPSYCIGSQASSRHWFAQYCHAQA